MLGIDRCLILRETPLVAVREVTSSPGVRSPLASSASEREVQKQAGMGSLLTPEPGNGVRPVPPRMGVCTGQGGANRPPCLGAG